MCEVCLNAKVWQSVAADHRIPLAPLPPREHDSNRFLTSHVVCRSHVVILLVKKLDPNLFGRIHPYPVLLEQFCLRSWMIPVYCGFGNCSSAFRFEHVVVHT